MARFSLSQLLGFVLMVLLLAHCRRNSDDVVVIDEPHKPKTSLETELSGLITDSEGLPIAGASIRHGKLQTFSDFKGYYQIPRIYLDAEQDFLQIQAAGYHLRHQALRGISGDRLFIRTALESERYTNLLNASVDQVYRLDSLYEVHIPKFSLAQADGTVYTGIYKVSPKFVALHSEDRIHQPMLMVDSNTNNSMIRPIRRLGLEFRRADQSEPLKLIGELVFVLRDLDQNRFSAAAEFHSESNSFHQISGPQSGAHGVELRCKRVEEILVGVESDYCLFRGKVKFRTEDVPYAGIQISLSGEIFQNIYASSKAQFSTLVPRNRSIRIDVLSFCDEVLESKELQLQADTHHESFDIASPGFFWTRFSGSNTDCNSGSGYPSYLILDDDRARSWYYPADADGRFLIRYPSCADQSIRLTAVEAQTSRASATLNLQSRSQQNLVMSFCKNEPLSLARFEFAHIKEKYDNCRVKIISNSNSTNTIFIFEYGNKGTFTEKLILEKTYKLNTGVVWTLSHFSFIAQEYQLKDLIQAPELLQFKEAGAEMLECNLPRVIIEHSSGKNRYLTELVYFKARIQN